MPNFIAGCQSVNIANQLIWFAHIATYNSHQGFVHNAAIGKFHNWDIQTFFVNAVGIRAKATTSNVDNMGGASEKSNKDFIVKTWGYDGYIM